MREISVKQVEELIEQLIIEASYYLPQDIQSSILKAKSSESEELPQKTLEIIHENSKIAAQGQFPLCQDTGFAIVFLEIGQDIHFCEGSLKNAIYNGVEKAYQNGFLRKSVVADPLRRINTNNNLPPIIYHEIIEGEQLKITVMPKGFGAENQSKIKLFIPNTTKKEIIDYIVSNIKYSGGKGCPPAVIGIGIGGTFEYAAYLAKKALLIPVDQSNPDPYYEEMENNILNQLNQSKIGPLGIGGLTTALSVKILTYATHIAGLPVAYNYCCHSCRHKSMIF